MAIRKLPSDAFSYYLGLGVERSYQAVADHYGASKTAVANLAHRENWQGRLLEVERKARQNSDEKAVETLADLNSRHLKMLRTVQGKALEDLRGLSLETGMDCARALDLSIKAERFLGEPTEATRPTSRPSSSASTSGGSCGRSRGRRTTSLRRLAAVPP